MGIRVLPSDDEYAGAFLASCELVLAAYACFCEACVDTSQLGDAVGGYNAGVLSNCAWCEK